MFKVLFAALGLAVGVSALAACGSLWQQNAPPVIVNNTGGDGGQTVLLTVLVLFFVAAAVMVAVLGMAWWQERRLRKQAQRAAEQERKQAQDIIEDLEDALVALTGQPVAQLRFTPRQVTVMDQATLPAIRSGG